MRVQRTVRYQAPFVTVRVNHLARVPLEIPMALATSEPSSCIVPEVVAHLRATGVVAGGRRAVSRVDGSLIARTVRLQSLAIQSLTGEWLVVAPFTVAVLHNPEALGVSGYLGTDFLGRFKRIIYELGPPDTLILEEP